MARKANTDQQSSQEKAAAKAAKRVERFRVQGNKKGKKAIAAIRALGNLANRRSYTWDGDQVNKLFGALGAALDQTAAKFDNPTESAAEVEDLL